MKVRRYLRGSGRVLAFVFIASVIWLLFDMAALRLSINDVNSQLLRERVNREKEIMMLKKQQQQHVWATQPKRRGFKHPARNVSARPLRVLHKRPPHPLASLSDSFRSVRRCSQSLVHDDLPTTTVIFCFVDEVWSTLLRSVHSVLNRSPPHLLKEIILVDDASTKDHLKEQLDEYMSQFPKVRIIRLKERQGLIRARLAGAAVAKGEVLTFLDSHIECNVGWLEPLLERVYLDRKKVPCPVIEVISDKDMRGIFKWPLVFGWSPVPEDVIKKNNMKVTDPIRCPVMAGGLFSIDKKYFFELGAYDPGLDVWGGENMEISFKIWMCGGEIEIIPCSRVGHIFRGQNPYKFPKDRQKTVERNLARVAEVWLDEYKDLFYGHGDEPKCCNFFLSHSTIWGKYLTPHMTQNTPSSW
uniref:Polypeptide N-acetylgalactosaminyltransferase 5 n=1 Tax=Fundulus heteroclitus TaxID=8078 RepID=A0A3Q2Q0R7_FUNHE